VATHANILAFRRSCGYSFFVELRFSSLALLPRPRQRGFRFGEAGAQLAVAAPNVQGTYSADIPRTARDERRVVFADEY
jgi:hypothetical protein